MKEFIDKHFADIHLGFLIIFFVCAAFAFAHWHYEKMADACLTAATGTLVGAVVMRFRQETDPAVLKLIQNGGNKPPEGEQK